MESSDIADAVVVDMIAGAVNLGTITSLWSSFITPQTTPGDTLRGVYAPRYAPPEILPKTVSFSGDGMVEADYTILSQLGEGGMGVVFEARQNHLDRVVALKMIRPERAGDPVARACFFYEAVITAGLEHPGIVPVLEFGQAQDGRDFYAMKKAAGVPWSRVLRKKTLEENLAVFDRVTDVAAYAHSRGILHRDLKPANVLLGDFGEVWVGDWGVAVARGADGTYRHAHPGGTPQYMPPEMARGDAGSLGPQSDVYLLGAILLEMVTGRPPHPAGSAWDAILSAAANMCSMDSDHPLMEVIRKALSETPADRYASVQELRDAVAGCLAMERCRAHMAAAEKNFHDASRDGEYALFQKAIAEYDAALAACPEYNPARRDRLRTLIAYSRRALANGEYDLALTIIEPRMMDSEQAAQLVKEIVRKKKSVARKGRRSRFTMAVVRVAVLSIVGVALVTYLTRWDGPVRLYAAVMTPRAVAQRNSITIHYYSFDTEIQRLQTTLGDIVAVDAYRQSETGIPEKCEEIRSICYHFMTDYSSSGYAENALTEQEYAKNALAKQEAACRYIVEQQQRLEKLIYELAHMLRRQDVPHDHILASRVFGPFSKMTELVESFKKEMG